MKIFQLEQENASLINNISRLKHEIENLKERIRCCEDPEIASDIRELKSKGYKTDRASIIVLEDYFTKVTKSSDSAMSRKLLSLSERELEICEMIRRGLCSRSIATNLKIAPKSVENHRNNIRRKLGIINNPINLKTYLRSLGLQD